MIDLEYIKGFYPTPIAQNTAFHKHLVKEHVELMVLDHLTHSPLVPKLRFIGGTNLRLVKGIDRFSEDIDFDCTGVTREEFNSMTDSVLNHLSRCGLNVESRDKDNSHLTAFRRNIYFPELLFNLRLTGHRDERFLLKIEMQDQGVAYTPETAHVNRNGFFFSLPVPPDEVLLSMKLSAILSRAKGRDFYDAMFLWQRTQPDYLFLQQRVGICTPTALRNALLDKLASIDLQAKQRDFTHLLFNASASERILGFEAFAKCKLPEQ